MSLSTGYTVQLEVTDGRYIPKYPMAYLTADWISDVFGLSIDSPFQTKHSKTT
ncbi:hypothetical protein G3567_10980 [Psychroflexus sp. YR1-1]|uniref:Uncharacterized protein n=1 Tax=Psychroflexus aurantiacus TaxID=2709310 RepID=A0A6B3R1Y9_9FLAO|nr:hypothetical protein [Psychroflexus aurantiacus]NEV94666.1 hypothetical protein [Psychroflexus aurantiacus]